MSSRALVALRRADAPARGRSPTGDRGLPTLVGRASRRRRADGRPPRRRPSHRGAAFGSGSRRSSSGGPLENRALPAVWHDEATVVVDAVRYLAALGHARIARVAGFSDFVHTEATQRSVRARHDRPRARGATSSRPTTRRRAARARRASSSRLPDPPTAIVFDSDLLAVTGLGVAQQMGFSVPDELSIVGWDDSLISQVVHPPLTAITRDITAFGVRPRGTCSRRSTAKRRGRRDGAGRAHAARQHGRAATAHRRRARGQQLRA